MKKLVFFVLFLFLFNINLVNAVTFKFHNFDLTNNEVESQEEFHLRLYGADISGSGGTVNKVNFVIEYDSNKIEYLRYDEVSSSIDSCITFNTSGSKIKIDVNCDSDNIAISDSQILKLYFKPKGNASTTEIKLSGSEIFNTNGDNIDSSTVFESINLNITEYIQGPKLENISVDGQTYPIQDVIDIGDTTKDKINIEAKYLGEITGIGEKELLYGENDFDIIITHNEKVVEYKLKVNRIVVDEPDEPLENEDNVVSSDGDVPGSILLKEIVIEGFNIEFKPDIFEYDIDLPLTITSLNISATNEDKNGTVSGIGNIKITPEMKSLTITSFGSSGKSRKYVINFVNRNSVNNSNKLKSLVIDGNEIELDGNIYFYGTDKTEIEIEALADSATASVEILDYTLVKGINKISIIVSDDEMEDSIYTIYVDVTLDVVATSLIRLPDILVEDLVMFIDYDNIKVIKDTYISDIDFSSYSLTFKIVNEFNGLLYSVTLTGDSIIEENLDLNISFIDSEFVMNMPKGVIVYYYIDNIPETLKLFDKNKEEVDFNYKNEYVSFITNVSGNYVYGTELVLDDEISDSNATASGNQNLLIIISIGLGIAVTFLIIFVIRNKHKFINKKEKNESSVLDDVKIIENKDEDKFSEIEKL